MNPPNIKEMLLSVGIPEAEIDNVIRTVSAMAILRAYDAKFVNLPENLRSQLAEISLNDLPQFVKDHAAELPELSEEDLAISSEKTWSEYVRSMTEPT